MADDPATTALRRLSAKALRWPTGVRDLASVSLALLALLACEVLLLLPLPVEAAFILPGILLAWWIFGWSSAALAAMVATLAVILRTKGLTHGFQGAGPDELLLLGALILLLLAACLAGLAWMRQRERRAYRLLDACVQNALGEIEGAQSRLAAAEADALRARQQLGKAVDELAQLRRDSPSRRATTPGGPDAAFDEAFRREGGI